MGLAAMMWSIDRLLVPVPALAPPGDIFVAMEKTICKIGPKELEQIRAIMLDIIDLDVCLFRRQGDPRFGGQCQCNELHRRRLLGWRPICQSVDLSVKQDENAGAHARIHTINCLQQQTHA